MSRGRHDVVMSNVAAEEMTSTQNHQTFLPPQRTTNEHQGQNTRCEHQNGQVIALQQ